MIRFPDLFLFTAEIAESAPVKSATLVLSKFNRASREKQIIGWLQASLFELPTSLFELRRDKTPGQDDPTSRQKN
jgi:hypothetical protein